MPFGLRSDALPEGRAGECSQIGRAELSDANLLARWTRQLRPGQDLRVQAYVDRSERKQRILFQPKADLWDIEVQHGMSVRALRFVWGAGYRYGTDDVENRGR